MNFARYLAVSTAAIVRSLNLSEVLSEIRSRPLSPALRRALAVHAVMPARYRRALQLHVGEDGVSVDPVDALFTILFAAMFASDGNVVALILSLYLGNRMAMVAP